MGSAKKIAEDTFGGAAKAVGSLLKGDVKKAADYALRGTTGGMVGLNKGSVLNLSPDIKGVDGKASSEALRQEAEDTAKRRVALFATQGDELGEEVFGVGKKKRGLLGN